MEVQERQERYDVREAREEREGKVNPELGAWASLVVGLPPLSGSSLRAYPARGCTPHMERGGLIKEKTGMYEVLEGGCLYRSSPFFLFEIPSSFSFLLMLFYISFFYHFILPALPSFLPSFLLLSAFPLPTRNSRRVATKQLGGE